MFLPFRFLIAVIITSFSSHYCSMYASCDTLKDEAKDHRAIMNAIQLADVQEPSDVKHLKLIGPVSAHLEKLSFFKEVESLDLSYSNLSHKTKQKIDCIFGLTQLKRLDLGMRRLDDEALLGLTQLTHLEDLSLRSTFIRGDLLPKIASTLSLVRFDVSHTHVADVHLGPFLESASLKWLNVERTFISDDMVALFKSNGVEVVQADS